MIEYFKDMYPCRSWRKARKEGDVLLVINDNLELYYLNDTADFFLSYCDGSRTLNSIIEQMANEYDIEMNVLVRDICLLIRDLQWNRLIEFHKNKYSVSR